MKRNLIAHHRDAVLTCVLTLFALSLYFDLHYIMLATVILLLTGAACIAYDMFVKKEKLQQPHPLVYGWLAVYLVRVAWLAASPDVHYGLKWLDVCLSMLLFPTLFQQLSLSERTVKNVLTLFVHGTLLFCAITLACVAYHSAARPVALTEWLHHPKEYYVLAYLWSDYDHPSFLCIIYLFALPAGLYVWRRYRAVPAAELLLLILLEAAMIAFTGTRIGLIAFPLMLLMMLIYAVPPRRRLITTAAAVVLAGLAITSLTLSGSLSGGRFNDPIRAKLWEAAVTAIKERPLLGTGTGGMRALISAPDVVAVTGEPFSYPHNQYLGEVMHFGLVGAIPLFATLLALLVLALRQRNFPLLALLALLLAFMLTEMPFDLYKSINFFLFFTSFLVHAKNFRRRHHLQ
jgi:O-antigen ligase